MASSRYYLLFRCAALAVGGFWFATLDLAAQEPAGYWCFEERSGDLAASLGDGPDAELINMGLSSWVRSDLDGDGIAALQFDGDDDVVVLDPENTIGLGDGDGFTLSMWLKTENEDAGSFWSVANHEEDWDMGNLGGWVGEGLLFADTAFVGEYEGATFVADGEWHHVAIVVEYNTVDDVLDTMSFYVDGFPDMENSETDIQEFFVDGQPLGNLQVGGGAADFPEVGGPRFDGLLDNVSVYTTALGAEVIADLAGSPGDGCQESPLNCDTSGDTSCSGIAVTPTENGEAGVLTFTVSAMDASGNDIIYSATASEVNDAACGC